MHWLIRWLREKVLLHFGYKYDWNWKCVTGISFQINLKHCRLLKLSIKDTRPGCSLLLAIYWPITALQSILLRLQEQVQLHHFSCQWNTVHKCMMDTASMLCNTLPIDHFPIAIERWLCNMMEAAWFSFKSYSDSVPFYEIKAGLYWLLTFRLWQKNMQCVKWFLHGLNGNR